MSTPIGNWPGFEAEDATWELVDPDHPDLLPPVGELVEVFWVVANAGYNTMRISYGRCTMVGDRHWLNENGQQVVFNPTFWRPLVSANKPQTGKPAPER